MTTYAPFSRPLYVMLKPVGARCNLACTYCYYLEKAKLYPDENRHTMREELLERFTKEYIQAQTQREVLFTWHGGETMLRPLSFYRRALELQQRYGKGRVISNSIQTNGTLLTEEWCVFLRENNWLVGISIDGTREMHNAYRFDTKGRGTFDDVMRGIRLLNQYGVEWNVMAVVGSHNVTKPLEFYRFFKEIGARYIQFTPLVERIKQHKDGRHLAHLGDEEVPLASFSITPAQWGEFLCQIFDEWVREDVGNTFLELFDATLANWVGHPPGICTHAEECGHAGVMEFNGDVYSCDHFVFPEYRLGNIREKTIAGMLYGEKQQAFSTLKRKSLPQQCRRCRFLFACNGECPKNRFAVTKDGEKGLNYLCEGYYRFYAHSAPYMAYMRDEYIAGRPPANVMDAITAGKIDPTQSIEYPKRTKGF